jgi:hypothetical protein
MMRSLGWIRFVCLVGVGLSAGPVEAQRAPEHRSAQVAAREYRQPPPQRQAATVNRVAPAAAAPRAMTTPVGAQMGSPGRRTSIETQAVTTPARTTTPGMMVDRVPQNSGRPSKDSAPTSATQQTPTNGATGQWPTHVIGRVGLPAVGSNSTTDPNRGSSSSDGNSKGSSSNGPAPQQPQQPGSTSETPGYGRQPRGQPTTGPGPWVPRQTLPPPTTPPIVVVHHPPTWQHVPRPAPLPPSFPGRGLPFQPRTPPTQAFQPSPLPARPSSPVTPQPASPAQTSPAPTQPTNNSGGPSPSPVAGHDSPGTGPLGQPQHVNEQGQQVVPPPPPPLQIVPALTLSAKTDRPVVGKDVEVVPALDPAEPGAQYQLNWGDGSKVEIVSGKASHHYAKAKRYTVSASTKVNGSELNHQIVLDVGPVVWHRVVSVMAVLAGAAFFFFKPGAPPLPKLSVSSRWGEPGVPEMKLLTREPYASLSFEPGLGPEEESITFASKGR